MKKSIYLIVAIAIFALASCKKDLLDSAPLDKYSDAAVWKDSSLVNLFVNGIYAGVPSEYDRSGDLLSNYTDESHNNRTFNFSYIYDQGQNNATNSPFNSLYESGTSGYYAYIRRCNTFLDRIGELQASPALKNRLTAEVRFLRALYYHYLFNFFGPFPIVKSSLGLNDNLYIPRGTQAECIAFIASELTACAGALPIKQTTTNTGRATRGAALALLSRTYLYVGDWQKASEAAKSVIDLNTYSLYPNYSGIFQPANEGNSEVIFDKQFNALIANGQFSLIDYYSLPPNLSGRATGSENPNGLFVDAFEMKDGTNFDWNDPVKAAKPWENRDPRLAAIVVYDGATLLGQTIDMKRGSMSNPSNRPSVTGYYLRKFNDPAYNPTNFSNYSGQNFILIRYAEVLLNYAEAQFNLGNTEEARKYVNLVRARPTVAMPAITAANFNMEKLRNERFIELSFEGLRLWDINRWKIGQATRGASSLTGVDVTGNGAPGSRSYKPIPVNVGRQFSDKMYLFPIPFNEILKYPSSTPLTQNPGW